MCWPLLSCCCGALLSWSATTRRAQQRLHRCNFGELDKLLFYERNPPQRGFPCWLCFNARICVCVRKGGLCLAGGTTLCLSFSLVCLRVDDRGFWSSRWARLKCLAGEDKGVESRPAVPPLPVGSKWNSCKPFFLLKSRIKWVSLVTFRLCEQPQRWPRLWAPLAELRRTLPAR